MRDLQADLIHFRIHFRPHFRIGNGAVEELLAGIGCILTHEGVDIVNGVVLQWHLSVLRVFDIRVESGGINGLAFLEEVVIILVSEAGTAAADNGGNGRIEDDGNQSPGKTIVVEVQSRHGAACLQHQGRVDKTRQNAEQRAEVAGNGGKGGAEKARQLQGGVIRRIVHAKCAKGNAQHHGDDVENVLAGGGKPHDGENAADSRAVKVTADQEDVKHAHKAVDADVHQHRAGAEHTQIIAGRTAGSMEEAPVTCPDGPVRKSGAEKATEDQHQAKDADYHGQLGVVPFRPVERGIRFIADGREHGDDHHCKNAAGKAHIIKVHAVLDLIGVGSKRWQQKTDHHTHCHAQRNAGVDTAKGHITHKGRKGRCQQGNGGIFGKGLPLVAGIKPCSEDNGPDVKKILSKEGKARHEANVDDGMAIIRIPGNADDENGDQRDDTGIDKGRTGAGNLDIVCDQQVLHGDDAVKALQDPGTVFFQEEPQEHQSQGKYDGRGKDLFVTSLGAAQCSTTLTAIFD